VFNSCGCFQGSRGVNAQAVDMARLMACYTNDNETLDSASLSLFPQDLKNIVINLGEVRIKARAKNVISEIQKIKKQIAESLGDPFDKDAVVANLSQVVQKLKEMGVWDERAIGITLNEFKKVCEEFRLTAVKESLDRVAKVEEVDETDDNRKLITKVSQITFGPLLIAQRFVATAEKVITQIEKYIESQKNKYEGVDPNREVRAISQLFEQIQETLTLLQTEVP